MLESGRFHLGKNEVWQNAMFQPLINKTNKLETFEYVPMFTFIA